MQKQFKLKDRETLHLEQKEQKQKPRENVTKNRSSKKPLRLENSLLELFFRKFVHIELEKVFRFKN